MLGWRGRIAYMCPFMEYWWGSQWAKILPEGIELIWNFAGGSGVEIYEEDLRTEDFERIFELYFSTAQRAVRWGVGFICLGDSPVFTLAGYAKAVELEKRIQETTGIPTMIQLTAHVQALRKLGAKKIVAGTTYPKHILEARKRELEELGFEVLSIKGTGCGNRIEVANQPSLAAYRVAKEAFSEAPEADAIYIPTPCQEAIQYIALLEEELGKPVVAELPATLWAALSAMHMKIPIKGYGRLLEEMP